MKELKISAIREGTVIDHVPMKNTFKLAEILSLDKHDNIVSVATNLPSKKMGKKGIIKVGGKELTKDELNKVSLLAPDATVSIIKDFEVKDKFKIELTKNISKIIKCSNPKCITNVEDVPTKFTMENKEPLKVRCEYCERVMKENELIIK